MTIKTKPTNPKYRAGHEKIYGKRNKLPKGGKRSYVWCNGRVIEDKGNKIEIMG